MWTSTARPRGQSPDGFQSQGNLQWPVEWPHHRWTAGLSHRLAICVMFEMNWRRKEKKIINYDSLFFYPHHSAISAGSSPPTSKGEKVAAALAVSCSVSAHKHNTLEFCLAWDMPQITFGSREKEHSRYMWWCACNQQAGEFIFKYWGH